jgi:hypothetical protein
LLAMEAPQLLREYAVKQSQIVGEQQLNRG